MAMTIIDCYSQLFSNQRIFFNNSIKIMQQFSIWFYVVINVSLKDKYLVWSVDKQTLFNDNWNLFLISFVRPSLKNLFSLIQAPSPPPRVNIIDIPFSLRRGGGNSSSISLACSSMENICLCWGWLFISVKNCVYCHFSSAKGPLNKKIRYIH